MSNQIDLNQRVEIRYATGDMVGIVLAPKAVQELTGERDQLREETKRLRAEVAELRRALEEAQREVQDKAAIVKERDLYLQELESFWAETIAEAKRNPHTIEEVLQMFEQHKSS